MFESTPPAVAFVLGRTLFAVVVGYLALGNLLGLEAAIGYAEHNGAPCPSITVPLGSFGLVVGAGSILLDVYPMLGALAILAFLTPITVLMHDFWRLEGQDRQNERIHFFKNLGLLGVALMLLALSSKTWPWGVGLGL